MIGRPTRRRWRHAVETEIAEIEAIDEDVDRANRIVVAHPVVETLRH
jgi:hypothetical protein